jgi:pimeloyl-ACP methyl ester carboxylesterase
MTCCFPERKFLLRLAKIALAVILLTYAALVAGMWLLQEKLMFHPSHDGKAAAFADWTVNGDYVGLVRDGDTANVWLVLMGNTGEVARFTWIAQHLPPRDRVYFLEYPGYGRRPGNPSASALNAAAEKAVADIRAANPKSLLSVFGVSLGTGVASHLGLLAEPPERIVLAVPFRRMREEAQSKYPYLPSKWLVKNNWDNAAALKNYKGTLDIYACTDDRMIPVKHARALKADLPRASYRELPGGHGDWGKSIGVLSDSVSVLPEPSR